MKIKTELLKELVSKAIKGASNNKMIPLTGFMSIEVKNNILSLTTTDGNNILRLSNAIEATPDFYTVVDAELFAKLVGKLSTEYTELDINENFLEIHSNGNYKLDIPLDSEGNAIVFDTLKYQTAEATSKEIDANKLKNNITVAKVAVADVMETPVLTGYYFGNNVITTNREKVCFIGDNLFGEPILLSYNTCELLQLFTNATLSFKHFDNKFIFSDAQVTLYCTELEGKENYPVDVIEGIVKTAYTSEITFKKDALLDILDRMTLFVSDYDKNGVQLRISGNELEVTSQKSNAKESLVCTNNSGTTNEYICLVDIDMLKTELQAITSEDVSMYYGNEDSIKLQEDSSIMILSLIQPEV